LSLPRLLDLSSDSQNASLLAYAEVRLLKTVGQVADKIGIQSRCHCGYRLLALVKLVVLSVIGLKGLKSIRNTCPL
jgi:hypothetical protein